MFQKPTRTDTIERKTIFVGERARQDIEDKELQNLVKSIRSVGLIEPLAVVEGGPDGHKYTLLAGGRRIIACDKLDYDEIPVNIYPKDIDEEQRQTIELHENLHRVDLSWAEEKLIKAKIHELQLKVKGKKSATNPEGASMAETAKELKTSKADVSRAVQMAEALKAHPELAKAKTEKQARQMLDRMEREVRAKKIAQEVKEESSAGGKFKKMVISSYVTGNALEGLSHVAENTADLMLIDPPYVIDFAKRRDETRNHDIDYTEWAHDDMLQNIPAVLAYASKILKPEGWLILWFATTYQQFLYDMLGKFKFAANTMPAIWYKGGQGETMRPDMALAPTYEPFIYARHAGAKAKLVKKGRSCVFHFKPVPPAKKIHETEKPIELMEEIIATFSGVHDRKTIVSPFLGSGNDILAGVNHGHRVIGWDLSEKQSELFADRVMSSIHPFRSYDEG